MKSVIFAVMLFVSMVGMASAQGWSIFGNDYVNEPGQPAFIDEFPRAKTFSTKEKCDNALKLHRATVAKRANTDSNGAWTSAASNIKFTRIYNATCQTTD